MHRIKTPHLFLFTVLALLLMPALVLPSQPTRSQSPLRIGLLGDSTIDEYRGTDSRGKSSGYADVTLNWVEQLVMYRNVDAGEWGNYPEPRRTGYAYNWSRSGANAGSLIASGQHTGLAEQVANGEIDLVIISIGNNDFAPWAGGSYTDIYNGTLAGADLESKINDVVRYITTAVDTILEAGPVPLILTPVGEFELSPLIVIDPQYADASKRQRVSDAVAAVNEGINNLAASRGISVFDLNGYGVKVLSGLVSDGALKLDDVSINFTGVGDDPHNLILGDTVHAGTVLEGLVANGYLEQINALVDPDIALFSNQEILAHAGLAEMPEAATVANGDSLTTPANSTLSIPYANLLGNDSAANQSELTVASFTAAQHGKIASDPNGLTYTPDTGYSGSDTFTYTIVDQEGSRATASVTITITP